MWRGLLFFWTVVVVGLAINIGATLLTTKNFDPKGTPLEWLVQHLPLALACGGGLFLLTVIMGALGRQEVSSAAPPLSVAAAWQNRNRLIQLLRNEYSRQLTQLLQGAAMIVLGLRERADVIHPPTRLISWRIDAPGERVLSRHTSIIQAYNEAGDGLLILGAPGAGKSTLLLELAYQLLARAGQDGTQPVPVILNLSSWATKKLPLTDWLIGQLQLVYNIPRRLSQVWIEQNQLLFLLDGLDEVGPSARTSCIECINTYRGEHFVPLVICARSHEYLMQQGRLRVSIAVEVQPLTPELVDNYLDRAGPALAAVRAGLRSNAVLRDLVSTPLMLSVVMLAYRGKTANDLPYLGSAEQQQQQIFEHYVACMLQQPARRWQFASRQTMKWLIWLAQQMKQHQLTEFYLERLQPAWLPTKRSRIIYALFNRPLFMWGFWVQFFGLRGRFSGMDSERFFDKDWEIKPSETLIWSWKPFWQESGLHLGGMLFMGLIGALLTGLFTQAWGSGLLFGLFLGVIGGLAIGLPVGLKKGLSAAQINEHIRLRPNQGIQASGSNAIRSGLLGGLIGELCVGLSFWLVFERIFGLLVGLRVGLLFVPGFGLFFGLVYGGKAYLQHYFLRYLLWRDGAIPWHYVRFLEEASERILLQRVGGGYRFIHPLFLDYFASLDIKSTS